MAGISRSLAILIVGIAIGASTTYFVIESRHSNESHPIIGREYITANITFYGTRPGSNIEAVVDAFVATTSSHTFELLCLFSPNSDPQSQVSESTMPTRIKVVGTGESATIDHAAYLCEITDNLLVE